MPNAKTKALPKPSLANAARAMSAGAGPAKPGTKDTAKLATKAVRAEPTGNESGELLELELDAILIADNPRTVFDPATLQELADSIASIGLLQPILVGEANGTYTLIAGGRRWRACKLAGKQTAPCYVRRMSEFDIVLARLAENLKREDLTCLDEANGYQRALGDLGITQAELGRRLGVSQGQISNRLRLLKLPSEWQARIISGEITASQARDLVPWADFPVVLDSIQNSFQSEYLDASAEDEDADSAVEFFSDLKPRDWASLIEEALMSASSPISGWRNGKNSPGPYDLSDVDEATRERLQVHIVDRGFYGQQQRCFNVDAWEELSAADADRRSAREEKKLAKAEKGSKKAEPTKEDLKQRAAQLNARLYKFKLVFLQREILKRLKILTDSQLTQFILSMALCHGGSSFRRAELFAQAAKKSGLKLKFSQSSNESNVVAILSLDSSKLRDVLLGYFAAWCEEPPKSYNSDASPERIEFYASLLGVSVEKDWQVNEEFLQLHTIEQLAQLQIEWKLAPSGASKKDKVAAILVRNEHKLLPAPQALLSCERCRVD